MLCMQAIYFGWNIFRLAVIYHASILDMRKIILLKRIRKYKRFLFTHRPGSKGLKGQISINQET